MPRIELYLAQPEWEWVKRQERGVLRAIVKEFIRRYPDKVPVKKEES